MNKLKKSMIIKAMSSAGKRHIIISKEIVSFVHHQFYNEQEKLYFAAVILI